MATTALDSQRLAPPGPRVAWIRLSLMMLLQYAVWGVWLPILAKYLTTSVEGGGLGFTNGQMGWILGLAGSIGAVSAPFIAGQLADRIMNAERALGVMLILGGVVKLILGVQTGYFAWMMLSIAASVLYMPTLSLSNSVAFAHLSDRDKQFPPIRAWGTIGWIIASVAFPLIFMSTNIRFAGYWPFIVGDDRVDAVAQMKYAMIVSGFMSIGYGLYALLLLPATPPHKDAHRPLAFSAAFKLLTHPRCLALMFAALLVSMIHQVYFFRTPGYITDAIKLPASAIGSTMAIGQVSEIIFLAILGLFLKQIGFKWIIVLGALSYAARYAIFGMIPPSSTVKVAMLLHGMNYGFFFAGSFLFVEKLAPVDIRHSAQLVFGIIILGIGPVLAGTYNEWLDTTLTADAVTLMFDPTVPGTNQVGGQREVITKVFDYGKFWYIQSGIALLAMLIVLLGFSGRTDPIEDSTSE